MNVNVSLEYDKTDPLSIEKYAKGLLGKSFRQVIEEDDKKDAETVPEDGSSYGVSVVSEKKRNKGNLGQIIEERFFHYPKNNDDGPDFAEAGVELKVTPYRIKRNGGMSAKERLILTMIDYYEVVKEPFEESHLWRKSRLILLIYYLYQKEIKVNIDYKIGYSQLFSPPEQDVRIIRHDYNIIISKIKAGKAHELSEADTLYLGAAPKAATSQDRRTQPYSDITAKPRAFAFKTSYMTYVLNNYIVPGNKTYEPIIKGTVVESFEDYVIGRVDRYIGRSVEDLCLEFNIDIAKKAKNLEAMLAFRILGVKGNHAEEFEKANIAIKTIRIEKNDRIRENMSFPTFKFKELIEEEWDDSTFGNYLRETRFFFVVYKFDENDKLRLKGCQFWNIPYDDLETEVKRVWEKTKSVIKEGLQITVVKGQKRNNFPKVSESPICHVRPHARNAEDTYDLPDGRKYPKQCFWLRNTYVYEQIDPKIKD